MAKKSTRRVAETISIVDLLKRFPDEGSCVEWLEHGRWGGTPVCPHCGGFENVSVVKSKKFTYWHKDCRKHFTVKTGTVMHSTKTSLQNWVAAIYLVLTARKGISAMQLSKELSVQYRTAWHMLHRIREACDSGTFKLSRVVEVDETLIGGKEPNKHKSKKTKEKGPAAGKTIVVGLKERGGMVLAGPVNKVNTQTMKWILEDNTEPETTIYSDESSIYNSLSDGSVNHSAGEYVRGDVHTNSIENFWSLFKRSINGTWHHVSVKHLSRYLAEATFRLNQGNCQVDTMDRIAAVAIGIGASGCLTRSLLHEAGRS